MIDLLLIFPIELGYLIIGTIIFIIIIIITTS